MTVNGFVYHLVYSVCVHMLLGGSWVVISAWGYKWGIYSYNSYYRTNNPTYNYL